MTDVQLTDPRHERKYFVMVMHLIRLGCRDVYDYALWCTVAEVAGEEGECWLDTRDLAAMSLMSIGKVTDSRRHLIAIGLLEGEKRTRSQGGNDIWHMRIPDLWAKNVMMMQSFGWRERLQAYVDRIEINRDRRKAGQRVLTALEIIEQQLQEQQMKALDDAINASGALPEGVEDADDLSQWFPREEGEGDPDNGAGTRAMFQGDYLDALVRAHRKRIDLQENDDTFGGRLARLWIDAKGIDRSTYTDAAWEKLAERMTSIVRKSGVKIEDEQAYDVMEALLDPKGDNAFMVQNAYTNEYVKRLQQDFAARARQFLSDGAGTLVVEDGKSNKGKPLVV